MDTSSRYNRPPYDNAMKNGILVKQIVVDGGFRVEVENEANGETAS